MDTWLLKRNKSAKSDLYTLAVMAYEAFTGQHPFDDGDID